MRFKLGIFLTAGLFFVFLVFKLFFRFPALWPDEALFAEVSHTLLTTGKNALPLWKEFFPGIEHHQFLMPPFYFYIQAAWMNLVGDGILGLRLLSVVFSFAVLFLLWKILSTLNIDRGARYLVLSLLLVDPLFLRGSLVARMDMMALSCGLLALWQLLLYLNFSKKINLLFFSLAASLAFLTHPFTVFLVLPLAIYLLYKKGIKDTALFAILFFVVSLVWLIPILQNQDAFLEQFQAQWARKSFALQNLSVGEIFKIYGNEYFYLQQNFTFLEVTLPLVLAAALLGLYRRQRWLFFMQCCLVFGLLRNLEIWYLVWILPLTILGLAFILQKLPTRASLAIVFIHAIGLIIATMGVFSGTPLMKATAENPAAWAQKVALIIPENSKVFVSSIPDPYFELKKKNIDLIEFLPTGLPQERLSAKVLDTCDYVVVGDVNPSPTVAQYLIQNKIRWSSLAHIKLSDEYGATVYAKNK